MKILLLLAALANTVYLAYSLCGMCSLNNFACVDVDKFQVCSEGVPQLPTSQCPPGYVCTPDTEVCAKNSSLIQMECNSCGKCNAQNVFACTTYNTFSLCYGTRRSFSIEYTCPGDMICNIESPSICVNPDEFGMGITCPVSTLVTTTSSTQPTTTTPIPTTEPAPTTINPVTSPREFCTSKGVRGRFEVLSDPKCSKFINCYESNGVWIGNIYLCPANTYFNNSTQMCGRAVPSRCSSLLEVCD